MSTIHALNYGDGSSSVPASAVLRGTAKAWANYDQTVPTVRASFGVSSITDVVAGAFGVNMTNAFSDTFYVGSGVSRGVSLYLDSGVLTTTRANMLTSNASGTLVDYIYDCPSYIGDLA